MNASDIAAKLGDEREAVFDSGCHALRLRRLAPYQPETAAAQGEPADATERPQICVFHPRRLLCALRYRA